MEVQLTAQEIARKYDRFAPWFDFIEGIMNLLGMRKLRKHILRNASGKILEVAVGTGKNLPYYPRSSRIVAVNLSSEMLRRARRRATELRIRASFVVADAAARNPRNLRAVCFPLTLEHFHCCQDHPGHDRSVELSKKPPFGGIDLQRAGLWDVSCVPVCLILEKCSMKQSRCGMFEYRLYAALLGRSLISIDLAF